MAESNIDIVVRVQQLTQQAFGQVSAELKKLENQATATGQASSKGLAGGLSQAKRELDSVLGSTIGWRLGVAGLVAGVGAAVTQTFAWAGSLSDLSRRTDISIETLQKFEAVAIANGNSLEEVANAAMMLSDRLAGGDASAAQAVRTLGLNVDELLRLGPEEAFKRIAEAIAAVPGHAERTALAADLLGRSGKALVPTLLDIAGGMDGISTASPDTVEKMARLGDQWDELKRKGKVLLADVLVPMFDMLEQGPQAPGMGIFDAIEGWWSGTGRAPKTPASALPTTRALTAPGLPEDLQTITLDLKQQAQARAETNRQLTQSLERAARAAERLEWSLDEIPDWLRGEFDRRWKAANPVFTRPDPFSGWPTPTLPLHLPSAQKAWDLLPGLAPPAGGNTVPLALTQSWWSKLGGLGGGLQVGSQLFGNLASLGVLNQGNVLGQGLSGALTGLATGSGISSMMSSLVGASVWGPLAPIGAAVGAAIPLLKKLFGPREGEKTNDLRDQFLAQFGGAGTGAGSGFAELAKQLHEIGPLGDQLFSRVISAKKTNEFTAAMQAATKALDEHKTKQAEIADLEAQLASLRDEQTVTWERLEQAAARYGVSLDALGPKFQQLKATDAAQKLLSDFDLLVQNGGDVGGILAGMSDEISQLAQQSIKFGTTIPENLRPLIEELARTGRLLDENGNKIDDLSGLTFGEPVKTQAEIIKDAMQQLVDKLEELRQQLAGGLPKAAQDGAAGVDAVLANYRPRPIKVPVEFEGGGEQTFSRPYAAGGVVTRTTHALLGEGGEPEIVGPVDFIAAAMARAARLAGSGIGTPAVRVVAPLVVDKFTFGRAVLELGFAGAQAHGLA